MKTIRFENDIDMYEYLDQKLISGSKITKTVGLSVILDDNLLLEVDSNIIKKELLFPDYNDTFLNVIKEIKDYYNAKTDTLFGGKYNKVVILLLDGMGVNILNNNLNGNSFIRSLSLKKIHSIYPSTTAASTTSIKSGLSPISSGWTGWENYFSEINRDVVLFTGNNYFTGEPTGVNGYKKMPYRMFYEDLIVKGYDIEPDFTKDSRSINDVLQMSLKMLEKNEKQIQYVYYTEPDGIMHKHGAYSNEAKIVLKEIDESVCKYANKLSDDTLLIITSDHGHTDVLPINLYACKPILRLLRRNPANDARCISFAVKEGKNKEFEFLFNSLFSNVYKLYKTTDAIALGFFGKSGDYINPVIDDFLADYVAVGISNYYFNYSNSDFVFKSHHAGITKDEMLVPVCIYKK